MQLLFTEGKDVEKNLKMNLTVVDLPASPTSHVLQFLEICKPGNIHAPGNKQVAEKEFNKSSLL